MLFVIQTNRGFYLNDETSDNATECFSRDTKTDNIVMINNFEIRTQQKRRTPERVKQSNFPRKFFRKCRSASTRLLHRTFANCFDIFYALNDKNTRHHLYRPVLAKKYVFYYFAEMSMFVICVNRYFYLFQVNDRNTKNIR